MIEICSGFALFRTLIEESSQQTIAVTDFITGETGFFLEISEGFRKVGNEAKSFSKSVRTGRF